MNQDPLQTFVDSVIEKGDFHPDSRRDRRLFHQMRQGYRALIAQRDGQLRFEGLLGHDNPHVRMWVATQLICTGHMQARVALEDLSHHTGHLATNALLVIAQFESGQLHPPFQ